jgi:hypothetical protein
MAGIRILERSGDIVSHSAVWAGPEEVPVIFVIVKDGATALAHPDYVGSIIYDVDQGDITIEQAWDVLMVKTPKMAHPQVCRVRTLMGTGGGAEILIGKRVVHRIGGVTE